MTRLGDILVNHGAIDRETLENVLSTTRNRIGDVLRAQTLIRSHALARALAEQQGLTFIDLQETRIDLNHFQPSALEHYLAHRYLPHRWIGNHLQVVTPEPSPELKKALERHHRCPIDMAVISHRDFNAILGRNGANALTRRARISLRRRYRHLVADRVLNKYQMRGLAIIAAVIFAALFFAPSDAWRALLIFCNLFYFVTLAFKLQLYIQGQAERGILEREASLVETKLPWIDESTLPVYSILVPIYKESFPVLARLISHLHALDYPKEKLDIKLIVEADDHTTIDALKTCRPPETMEILRVAPSSPRTKPKACNVALQQIRGEYVVIFDAEDAPEPSQLKRAVTLFTMHPREVACLQAPLNYYNRDENLLTKLFSIEYSALFHLLLPAMQRLQLPIPLGGTSNHLRVEALKRAGGWDAFNVTEDADLGMRLAWLGYRTRMLPSLTLEEAPIYLSGWLKQRTRWIKGYIQTWLVYMRDPRDLKQRLGPRAYYGFQFFIGAPALTFLLAPIFWGVFILGLCGLLPTELPPSMIGLCAVSFVGGMLSHWLFARAVIRLENWKNMAIAVATYPFYWLLHSLAAARALWQLITAPHYWDKTTHGISRIFAA